MFSKLYENNFKKGYSSKPSDIRKLPTAADNAKGERGKGEGPGEGGGSQGELGEGPGVVDLQRCWGCPEQSYTGRI